MDTSVEIAWAWDLFQLGGFAEVESMLSGLPLEPEIVKLLLWISIRRGDAVAKRRHGAWLSEHGGVKLAAVGRAHENVALAALGYAIKEWFPATSKWAQAEVAYARALVAFMRNAPHEVRQELSAALPQIPEQRVRYADLRAWIEGLHENFERHATHLLHALSLAQREDVDAGLVAGIAESLAPLVRELDLGALGDRSESLLSAVAWPKDATISRFYTQRALAWRRALRGEWIQAMQLLDGTISMAPDAMRRGLVFADRARIARAIGERTSAQSACGNAIDCFDAIGWVDARNEEAMGVFAAMDVLVSEQSRAEELFRRACALQVSKMIGAGHGRRLAAFKSFALSHLCDGDEALRHAHDAYIAFKEMKYVHRATSCALRAIELGGGARWRKRVERMIAPYPRSLEARQYEQMNSPLSKIQGRKREVAQLLASSNKTAREIGEALGMAEGTVRVHIKHINRILHTENRAQLVRLVMGATDAA
ncbi:MAG TPA: LuxR C-terminal-related transcriptional regulator [Candidatus Aquilonibacter sp.]